MRPSTMHRIQEAANKCFNAWPYDKMSHRKDLGNGGGVRATHGVLMYTRYCLRIMIVHAQERSLEAREGPGSLT